MAAADGDIDNTAEATATRPTPVDDSEERAGCAERRALVIDKIGAEVTAEGPDATATAAGGDINYTFTVTNNGNVTLTNVTVTDPLTCGTIIISAADGAWRRARGVHRPAYALTQADIDSNRPSTR